jgi:hypothetical protein
MNTIDDYETTFRGIKSNCNNVVGGWLLGKFPTTNDAKLSQLLAEFDIAANPFYKFANKEIKHYIGGTFTGIPQMYFSNDAKLSKMRCGAQGCGFYLYKNDREITYEEKNGTIKQTLFIGDWRPVIDRKPEFQIEHIGTVHPDTFGLHEYITVGDSKRMSTFAIGENCLKVRTSKNYLGASRWERIKLLKLLESATTKAREITSDIKI